MRIFLGHFVHISHEPLKHLLPHCGLQWGFFISCPDNDFLHFGKNQVALKMPSDFLHFGKNQVALKMPSEFYTFERVGFPGGLS